MKEFIRAARNSAAVIVWSFILNFAWENAHAPLYLHMPPYPARAFLLLRAAAGDAGFTLAAYLAVGLFTRTTEWIESFGKRGAAMLALAGFAWAVLIETRALALGRWTYAPAMPLFPFLGLGLTPLLQMTLLLPLSLYLAGRRSRRNGNLSA